MRLTLALLCSACITAGAFIVGCTAAQQAAFNQAMTGSPVATATATTQPTGAITTPSSPTPNSVEGVTGAITSGAGSVAAATVGTPIAGYAAIIAGVGTLALYLERALVALGVLSKNSASSQSSSSFAGGAGGSGSGSGGGSPNNSGSPPLKAA